MRRVIFPLLLTLFLEATALRADVSFDYSDPSVGEGQLVFTDEELKQLQPLLSPTLEPDAYTLARGLAALSSPLRLKLQQLAAMDQALSGNQEAWELKQAYGFTTGQLNALRTYIFDATAMSIIHTLQLAPTVQVRLLGRDMDEIYGRTISLLSPESTELKIDDRQKLELLKRVKLALVSRPVAAKIDSADRLAQAFQISPADAANSTRILLIDGGYDGTIPKGMRARFEQAGLAEKIKWSFLWKSPLAPAEVDKWNGGEVEAGIYHDYPAIANPLAMAGPRQSVRVNAVEHQAKWNGRSEGFAAAPVVILLDLDDTVLKEVPIDRYGKSPEVQAITYKASPENYAKYQARLQAPLEPGKVIHFELLPEGVIKGYVTVRPGLAEFFEELMPAVRTGAVRILLTSANDPLRSQAMEEQLKIGGKTLKEWGVQYVPKEHFSVGGGVKDIGLLRQKQNLASDVRIIALDDLPSKIRVSGPNDFLEGIRPWDFSVIYDYLDHKPQFARFALEDGLYLRHLINRITPMTQLTTAENPQSRLRLLAELTAIDGLLPRVAPNPRAAGCAAGMRGL